MYQISHLKDWINGIIEIASYESMLETPVREKRKKFLSDYKNEVNENSVNE